MSYLSAKNAGVLESGGGGGLPGTQNLEEVLSLGASAGGIAITSCPSVSNSSGVVALSGESLTLTSQGLVGVVAPLGLAISGDVGTAGFVLTSGGVGAPPAWEVSGAGVTPTLAAVMDVGAQASAALDMNQFDISNPYSITANNTVDSFVIKNIAVAGMTLGATGKPLSIYGPVNGVGTVGQVLQSNGTGCDWQTVSGITNGLSDVTLVNANMSADLNLNGHGISSGDSLGTDGQVLTSDGAGLCKWVSPYTLIGVGQYSDLTTLTVTGTAIPAGSYLVTWSGGFSPNAYTSLITSGNYTNIVSIPASSNGGWMFSYIFESNGITFPVFTIYMSGADGAVSFTSYPGVIVLQKYA